MRAAMAATSENIANAQTPGYVDESAQLSALPGGDSLGVGDGVQVTTVAQATNALLAANNWQAQGSLANLSSLQQVLTGVENLFPLGNSTSSTSGTSANDSLAGELASFWSQWDAVAADPSERTSDPAGDHGPGHHPGPERDFGRALLLGCEHAEPALPAGVPGQRAADAGGPAESVDPHPRGVRGRCQPGGRPAQCSDRSAVPARRRHSAQRTEPYGDRLARRDRRRPGRSGEHPGRFDRWRRHARSPRSPEV